MVEARNEERWNHTAALLAMMVNTAFGKKGKPLAPDDFHPYARFRPRRRKSREEIVRQLNAMVGLKEHGTKR